MPRSNPKPSSGPDSNTAQSPSTEKNLNRRLRTLLALLVQTLHPRRIRLFGYRAKGTTRCGSDIELAIDGPPPGPREERRLREAIDDAAGLYSVDLIFIDRTDPSFRDLIESTGKVLICRKRPRFSSPSTGCKTTSTATASSNASNSASHSCERR